MRGLNIDAQFRDHVDRILSLFVAPNSYGAAFVLICITVRSPCVLTRLFAPFACRITDVDYRDILAGLREHFEEMAHGVMMQLPLSDDEGGELAEHEVIFGIAAIESDMPQGAEFTCTKQQGGLLPGRTHAVAHADLGTFDHRQLRLKFRTIEMMRANLARNEAMVVAQHRLDADTRLGITSGTNHLFAMARFHDSMNVTHACDMHQVIDSNSFLVFMSSMS